NIVQTVEEVPKPKNLWVLEENKGESRASFREILRYVQSCIVTGRPLDVQDVTVSLEGETSYILINRYDVLKTALEEVKSIENPRVTLEVSFDNETAQDNGGPRREFFRICLKEIKTTYFDNGLKAHLADDYTIVGLIMALSTLQNGAIPRFLNEEDLQALFSPKTPTNLCIAKLQNGFDMLGLCQIGHCLPTFQNLFRAAPAASLTRRKLTEVDSNAYRRENEIYALFAKYTRKAASGQRGSVTLEHILQFATCSDEEPLLGFAVHPCIEFVDASFESNSSNTCANTVYIPKCSDNNEEELFHAYDCAFASAYFGHM
ncbi:leucine-rich repeat-containing DDB_G0290503 isoform X1, partial [Paramuricea clavata]